MAPDKNRTDVVQNYFVKPKKPFLEIQQR